MRSIHYPVRVFIVVAAAAMLALSAFAGGDKEKEDDLMQTALKQSVRSAGGTPFEMKVTGKVYGYAKPMDIEYETKWSAMNEWFDQISFGGFVERRLAQGDKLWMQRNAGFELLRPAQLHRMLDLMALHPPSDEELKGVEHHKGTSCAKMASGYDSYKLCFDDKGRLAREERTSITVYPHMDFSTAPAQSTPPVQTTYEYSDYAAFGDKSYPRKLRVLENGKPAVEAEVTMMQKSPNSVAAVTPPKEIEPQAWCADPTPARIAHITKDLPHSTELVGGYSTEGRVVVSGVIGADGKLDNQSITLRSTRGLDDPILSALRDWSFVPARCGQQAIAQDMFLDIQVEPRPGAMELGAGPGGPR